MGRVESVFLIFVVVLTVWSAVELWCFKSEKYENFDRWARDQQVHLTRLEVRLCLPVGLVSRLGRSFVPCVKDFSFLLLFLEDPRVVPASQSVVRTCSCLQYIEGLVPAFKMSKDLFLPSIRRRACRTTTAVEGASSPATADIKKKVEGSVAQNPTLSHNH
jgi:hypothetical protein